MKKRYKNIISILCVTGIFLLGYHFLKYILIDDASEQTRISLYQLYHSESNIDVLFLGSSHCFCSLNPLITDKEFGAYTFNAGSSAQYMDSSLAVAKEAICNHKIKQIYLEMYYPMAFTKLKKERTMENINAVYRVSDHIRSNLNRVLFLLQASSPEYYVDSFIIPRRNWQKLYDYEYLSDVFKRKRTFEYRHYIWMPHDTNNQRYYVDRGYYACDLALDGKNIWSPNGYQVLDFSELSSEWKEDLIKIHDLCKKNDITLTLFVAPSPEWNILGKENYNEYDALLWELSKELNVNYYNFDFCKQRFLNTADPANFRDEAGHLNTVGGTEFSHLFAETVTGKLNREDVLYKSLDEKIQMEDPRVFALGGPYTDENVKDLKFIKIISNRDAMEYQITINSEKEGTKLLQTFDVNKVFSIPADDSVEITIEWRMPENPEDIHIETFTYNI